MVRLSEVPEPEQTVIRDLQCPTFDSTPKVSPPAPADRKLALASSAGFILRGERPLLARETGYRVLPNDAAAGDILCSHVSVNFDRTGFQQDLNVMLPRDRLTTLVESGEIGATANACYSFMGATNPDRLEPAARELAKELLSDNVNTVVLAPV